MLCTALLAGCVHTGDGNTTEPMQQETAVEETVGAAADSSRENVQDTGTQSAETPEDANVRTEQSMEEQEEGWSAAENETAEPDEAVFGGEDEAVRRQLEIFVQARERWSVQEYDSYTPVNYTVCDLDRDGKPELITNMIMGTGLYSENHFYRINESADGILELPQAYYAEYAELDLGPGGDKKAFQDEKDGIIYYLDSDYTRIGAAEAWEAEGAFYLKDGQVYSLIYRNRHILADENGTAQESFYDASGNEVDREAWEQLYTEFCAGKSEVYVTMEWESIFPEDAVLTDEQLLDKLIASYEKGK